MIVKGYVTPHPPIILPEVGKGEEKKIQKTIYSMERMAKEIAEIKPETIIVSSPHAPMLRDGFYISKGKRIVGNLESFGINNVEEDLAIDLELVEEIINNNQRILIESLEENENFLDHGALIPIRFINKYYSDYKIILVGISGSSDFEHFSFGKVIRDMVEKLDRKTVFIASGDLSHVLKEDGPYGYKKEGPIFDQKIIEILSKGEFHKLFNMSHHLTNKAAQCGLKSFQMMAGAFKDENIESELYSYEGPFGVGYGVLGFSKKKSSPYVKLARESIEEFIKTKNIKEISEDLPEEMLNSKAATFVTLYKNDKLRGCIGTLEPLTDSIAEEIIRNSISSATKDPRFPVVKEFELKDLEISVDILKEAEEIDSLDKLDTKKYGVIVSKDYKRGVLLPNIDGVEDVNHQVSIALEKAGIRKNEDYKLERFEVIRHE